MNDTEWKEMEAQILKWSAEPPGPIEIAIAKRLYWETVIRDELRRAKSKFPEWPTDPIHAFAIVAEEFGEAAKEVLQLTYEPTKSTVERIRTETIQLAAMCHRFLESLDRYEFKPSAQHEQK